MRGWRRGLDGDTGRGEAHARVTDGGARIEGRAEVTHAGGGAEVARAGSGQEIVYAHDGAEGALTGNGAGVACACGMWADSCARGADG